MTNAGLVDSLRNLFRKLISYVSIVYARKQKGEISFKKRI